MNNHYLISLNYLFYQGDDRYLIRAIFIKVCDEQKFKIFILNILKF